MARLGMSMFKRQRGCRFSCMVLFANLVSVLIPFAAHTADANEAALSEFHGDTPALAQVLNESAVAALPQHVFTDGHGLPDGSGSVERGETLYAEQCADCHGSKGQGGRAIELVGDASLLDTEYPDRGIAVYWPYAPTLFEYIDRSMPPSNPASFSVDDLYSLIAHLLFLNGLLDADATLDAEKLKAIQMPNVDGFRTVGH